MLVAQSTGGPVLSQSPAAPMLFFAFAALVLVSAWMIVFSTNIVRMSVYLMLTLSGVAGLYFMLEAELLAAIQLIVYVGGTLVLIIFGVMLTSRNPRIDQAVSKWEIIVGVGLALMIALSLLTAVLNHAWHVPPATAPAPTYDQVGTIGRALLSTHLLPFEVSGVVLLVVMIGAALMARKRPN